MTKKMTKWKKKMTKKKSKKKDNNNKKKKERRENKKKEWVKGEKEPTEKKEKKIFLMSLRYVTTNLSTHFKIYTIYLIDYI